MKQAALNTFAALAVAALCAGAVFVGYDYLQDDNDDAPRAKETETLAETDTSTAIETPTEDTLADTAVPKQSDSLTPTPSPQPRTTELGSVAVDPVVEDALAELGVTLPMGEAEFIAVAEAAGIYIDVVTRDGEPMAIAAIEALGPQMSVEVEGDMVVRVVSFEDYDPVQGVLMIIGARLPMDEAEFVNRAEAGGYSVRVVARDGEYFDLTMDYSDTRLNVEVVDGQVVKVVDIG